MSTLQKHADFVRETMGYKPVIAIAGIGDGAGVRLEEIGFTKAYHLLGQFLVLSRDSAAFDAWLQTEVPRMSSKQRSDCIACLTEWCDRNL